jgi:hypothetical protein
VEQEYKDKFLLLVIGREVAESIGIAFAVFLSPVILRSKA